MSAKDTLEGIKSAVDGMSYQQATASGGLGGFLYQFAMERADDLLFIFLAGVIGAIGGAFAKWIISFFKQDKDDGYNN